MLFRLIIVLLVVILNTTLVVRSQSVCEDAAPIFTIALSPETSYVAAEDYTSNTVTVWNIKTVKEVHRFPYTGSDQFKSISFSDDGTQLLLGGQTEAVLWDIKTGKQTTAFIHAPEKDDSALPVRAYFVPESKYIVTVDGSSTTLWDEDSHKKVLDISRIESETEVFLDISRDGKYLLLRRDFIDVQIWNIESLEKIQTFDLSAFSFGRFTPDSKYIIYYTPESAHSPTSAIIQWDIQAKKEFRVLK